MAPHATSPSSRDSSQSGGQEPIHNGNSDTVSTQSEPIAIIGMACRLPGDSSSPSNLWDLLIKGQHGRRDIPKDRFNVDGFYHPNSDRPGSMSTTGAYVINEPLRNFQNDFFGINNLEAAYMDPQQRKLLEVTYECFESAGMPLEKVSGANIGAYVGNFTTDFITMQLKDCDSVHRYSATGLGTTILANRLTHAFNMNGPSFVIDTACSSSLYCLHAACTALDNGECDAAIVAGANLIQAPEQHIATLKAGVLSKTSTCHTFDSSADGYGRGDGVGALLVKRLSSAIRDGDPIRSIVRGTAANSNGKTNGITLPDVNGQEAVIRKAYQRAGLSANATQYVECHGTGTAVGDPIEVEALSRVMKRHDGTPTLIGSVKTNLGHSEAASAISSIIKVTMAMQHGTIPETVGVRNVNPKIKLDDWNVRIVTSATAWPQGETTRAGVNSFGYGGANAHAIIEAPPSSVLQTQQPNLPLVSDRNYYILPFSAYTKESLLGWVHKLQLTDLRKTNVTDLAYTLAERRTRFTQRGFAVVDQRQLSDDLAESNVVVGPSNHQEPLPYAFVFTGQGAQWSGMGKELMSEFATFRDSIRYLDDILRCLPHKPEWTIEGVLLEPAETSDINKASHSQPICTAVQVALVNLLQEWKIMPMAVVGHSSGEIAAAYAAGHITAAAAITSAYYRGYTVSKNSARGAMMAAGTTATDAEELIRSLNLGSQIRVACINSPESVTISGDSEAIDIALEHLQRAGKFARALRTDGRAYHSKHMAAFGAEYEQLLGDAMACFPTKPIQKETGVRFVSSVTCEPVGASTTSSPGYWRKNLENPVRFSEAVTTMVKEQHFSLIELGPHNALEMPLKQILGAMDGLTLPYASALSRNKNSVITALGLVGRQWNRGYDVSFSSVNRSPEIASRSSKATPRLLLDLPKYEWSYDQDLWRESRMSSEYRNRKYRYHDLLGSVITGGSGVTRTWRRLLKSNDLPWLQGHKLVDSTVLPGAAYLTMAVEALFQITDNTIEEVAALSLQNVEIASALVLDDDATEVFTEIRRCAKAASTSAIDLHEFSISSYKDGKATVHARGRVGLNTTMSASRQICVDEAKLQPVAPRNWYARFEKAGLNFSDQFKSMKTINVPRRPTEHISSSTVDVDPTDSNSYEESKYVFHPVTIDALIQTCLIATSKGVLDELNAFVPVQVDRLDLAVPQDSSDTAWKVDGRANRTGFGSWDFEAELYNNKDEALMRMQGVRTVAFQGATQDQEIEDRHPVLRVVWKPDITHAVSKNLAMHLAKEAHPSLLSFIDLLAHKNAALSYLNMTSSESTTTVRMAEVLQLGSAYQRCSRLARSIEKNGKSAIETYMTLEAVQELSGKDATDESFDVVIVDSFRELDQAVNSDCQFLVGNLTAEALGPLNAAGFFVAHGEASPDGKYLFIASRNQEAVKEVSYKSGITLVTRFDTPSKFESALKDELANAFSTTVKLLPLKFTSPAEIAQGSTVVCSLEVEKPLLAGIIDADMQAIKAVTDQAHQIVWITGGDYIQARVPEVALSYGLSRALMLEQPALRMAVVDLDDWTTEPRGASIQVAKVLRQLKARNRPDFEFAVKDETLHVGRFVPEPAVNERFTQAHHSKTTPTALSEIGDAQLSINAVGQFDTLHFRPIEERKVLPKGFVRLQITAAGINACDFDALAGRADTIDSGCNYDSVGIVTAVGEDVSGLAIGDRVLSMAPSGLATTKQLPAWTCVKLQDSEVDANMAALPLPFATALFALKDRAALQSGERVLVHVTSDGLGFAAVQIANRLGATVLATVDSDASNDFLIQELGISEVSVFDVRIPGVGSRVKAATSGEGVNVLLSSLNSSLPYDAASVLSDFGRYVHIGKPGGVDARVSQAQESRRGIMFVPIDLGLLYESNSPAHWRTWNRLLSETLQLYRSGKIRITAVQSYDASGVASAFRQFSVGMGVGRHVILMSHPTSVVKYLAPRHLVSLSPEKSYVLVGCLGGLGRSMSKYLMARGARKFIFLGRSGTDRKPARLLVDDLKMQGAQVDVVRGDVCDYSAVKKAVDTAKGHIGGVIQAAMGLNESLFTTMPNEHWHTGIDPKVVGTWNLHNAIKGRDSELDFFLMTSSVSGSVGTATESNYCAGNHFLDAFARFRVGHGLPAVSIGLGMISEVGYLHENPEIEGMLLRKGIQALGEQELLQIVDLALAQSFPGTDGRMHAACTGDALARGHFLTGLEPFGLQELRRKGFSGDSPVLHDPRASVLHAALNGPDAGAGVNSSSDLPAEVAEALAGGGSVEDAVRTAVAKRFAGSILMPVERLDVSSPLSGFGMDSMLAAEFRSWLYTAFKADIPFLKLLDKSTTVQSIAHSVSKRLQES